MEQKTCRLCGAGKPLTDFYKMPNFADGRDTRCKECAKAQVRANRRKNADHYRRYDKGRANLPHRIAGREKYLLSERGKEAMSRARKRHKERNSEKYAATTALNNALRDGRIEKGPCWFCGSTGKNDGHHHDYSQPLEVTWMCRACHSKFHKMHDMMIEVLLK